MIAVKLLEYLSENLFHGPRDHGFQEFRQRRPKCCNVGENSSSLCSSFQGTGQEKDLAVTGCLSTVISFGVLENQGSNLYAETKTTHRELESESSSLSPCCK